MAYKKYLNVDIIAFLEEKMNSNTVNYKTDFDYDKSIISHAAASDRKDDKVLLWMSRPSGTHCQKEHDVFVKDSSAYTTWCYYDGQTDDKILACAVEITGIDNGVVKGNIYDLDYRAHVADVKALSVIPQEYEKVFEDGYVDHASFERSSVGYFTPLVEEHGAIVDSIAVPLDKEMLQDVLRAEKQKRDRLRAFEVKREPIGMNVRDLDRNQLVELKQKMLCDRNEDVSYFDLAWADKLISDEEVFEEFDGISFVEEDFSVSADEFTLGSNVKEWYIEKYPGDELGVELEDDLTFVDVMKCLDDGEDIYDAMGVIDSLVRERVFTKVAEFAGVDYDVIYDKWMSAKPSLETVIIASAKQATSEAKLRNGELRLDNGQCR